MVALVGYATQHGSTRGAAERIGHRLRERDIAVDVRPMADVRDVRRYDAFVLGSAIHSRKWLPDAERFVERNADYLRGHPVWLFSVSTLGDSESMFRPRLARRMRAMKKKTSTIPFRAAVRPREHRNFAGAIARSHWPVSGHTFFKAMGGRYGDHRNWLAIDDWADGIAAQVLAARRRTVG